MKITLPRPTAWIGAVVAALSLSFPLLAQEPGRAPPAGRAQKQERPTKAWGQVWYPSVAAAADALGSARARAKRPQLVAAFRVLGELRGGT